jgi:hypothetical protein
MSLAKPRAGLFAAIFLAYAQCFDRLSMTTHQKGFSLLSLTQTVFPFTKPVKLCLLLSYKRLQRVSLLTYESERKSAAVFIIYNQLHPYT